MNQRFEIAYRFESQRPVPTYKVPSEPMTGCHMPSWADSLPHPDASFDAVFCTLVLHHLPKDVRETAIREMRRVLRPGGRLVLVDWQKPRSIWGAMTSGLLLIHILHSFGSGVMPLDSPELESLLKQLGFGKIDRSAFRGSVMGATVGRLAL